MTGAKAFDRAWIGILALGMLSAFTTFGCSRSACQPPVRSREDLATRTAKLASTGQWIGVGGSQAYLAIHVGISAPIPGVLVLHTARGLTRDVQQWTDRLAADGYAALAVDFYHGRPTDDVEEAKALRDEANKHPDENHAMLRDAFDFLASDPRIRARRRAILGWSYGGGWATHLASRWSDVDAVVAYYGTADADARAVSKIQAPVLLICGAQDAAAEDVVAFETALRAGGKSFQVVWNNEGHNFAEPSNPRYSRPAAELAYKAAKHFFEATLHN